MNVFGDTTCGGMMAAAMHGFVCLLQVQIRMQNDERSIQRHIVCPHPRH